MATLLHNSTLNKFGTRIDGENSKHKFYHLKTRYRVRFYNFGLCCDGDELTMAMQKCDSPKGAFTRQTVSLVNGDIYYPGKWTWDPLTFTVFNTYDNANYRALQNQLQRQRDTYVQNTGDAPSNYKFTAVFEHTDGHQKALSYWLMEGCYLEKAQADGGENQSHDPNMIQCSISFDNATLYDDNGIQIPQTVAGVVKHKDTALWH